MMEVVVVTSSGSESVARRILCCCAGADLLLSAVWRFSTAAADAKVMAPMAATILVKSMADVLVWSAV